MTCLAYLLYDEHNRLLYIGSTINLKKRIKSHRQTKPWWHEVAYITGQEYPDIDKAQLAETYYIGMFRPIYNVRWNRQWTGDAPIPWFDFDDYDEASHRWGTLLYKRSD